MNKYIIPYCDIQKSLVDKHVIMANSLANCREKLMLMYGEYSDSDDWNTFIEDLDNHDILIGRITDVEEL